MTGACSRRWTTVTAALVGLTLATSAGAQQAAHEWAQECESRSRRATVCEVRETRVASTGDLHVNARPNGGVRVQSWDGNEVLVQARVQAHASSYEEAERIAEQIRVDVRPGAVSASGVRTRSRQGWSVSYDVFVPRRTNLRLESTNGGLRVTDVEGTVDAKTTNGGINLNGVTGSVRGASTNGGISVSVVQTGSGIDLSTTNGGISLELPAHYGANLEARTVNGGISTNLPIQVQGRRSRSLEGQIAGGGPGIRLRTTNGGIRIESR